MYQFQLVEAFAQVLFQGPSLLQCILLDFCDISRIDSRGRIENEPGFQGTTPIGQGTPKLWPEARNLYFFGQQIGCGFDTIRFESPLPTVTNALELSLIDFETVEKPFKLRLSQ